MQDKMTYPNKLHLTHTYTCASTRTHTHTHTHRGTVTEPASRTSCDKDRIESVEEEEEDRKLGRRER